MEIFLQFLKRLFKKHFKLLPSPKFELGAFLNESDNRDIPYSVLPGVPEVKSFPASVTVKGFNEATRLNQGLLGTCVEHAFEFIARVEDNVLHSRRVPYTIARRTLGLTEDYPQGLPQREAAKIATIVGTPKDSGLDDNSLPHKLYTSLEITEEMRKEANLYRFGGFAFPNISVNGFKQVLVDGKLIAVTIAIDWSQIESDGTVHPPKKLAGYHEVVIGEYNDAMDEFRFANSWGNWGTNSDGFIKYDDLEKVVVDAIAFTDIPEDLKLRAKTAQYVFNKDLSMGTTSSAVGQLQTRLTAYGVYTGAIDRNYGPKTVQAVKDYQKFKGIAQDGKVGPKTRKLLNDDVGVGLTKTKLDLWIEAIIIMEGAKTYRNNPGNIRFRGQQFAENDNGFCKFDTYQHGYDALRNLIIRACSGLSSAYNPEGSLYEFYAGIPPYTKFPGYAPKSDGNDPKKYSEFVAKKIGVDPSVKIKTLLV